MRTPARLLVALVLGLGGAGALAAPAQAHAYLLGSDPADGSTLRTAPAAIHLQLSEAVVLEATHVALVDGAGHRVALGPLRAEEAADPGPDDSAAPATGTAVSVPLPAVEAEPPMTVVADVRGPMAAGSYRLTVDTLSADDMHRTTAAVAFGVGTRVVPAGRNVPPVPLDQALLRWVTLLGLGGGLGLLLVRRLASGSPEVLRALDRGRRLVGGTVVVAALASLALPLVEASGAGVPVTTVLEGTYGWRVLLHTLGLLLTLAACTRQGGRRTTALALAGAGAAALGSALLGHSGVAPVGPVRLAADVVHLLATATWLGGLVVLGGLLLTSGRTRLAPASLVAPARRFAAPAALGLGLTIASGLWLASGSVASVDALLLTAYGRALAVKVLLVAVAGLLGWRHHAALRRSGRRPTLPRTVVVEAGLVVLALGAAAFLASGQPATTPELSSAGDVRPSVAADARADDLAVHVLVRPDVPGDAIAILQVLDSRRPAPPAPTSVEIRQNGGTGASAATGQRLPDRTWSVPVHLVAPGSTTLHVVVRRPGLPDATADVPWVVGGGAPTPARVLSRAPVAAVLQVAAGLLLLVVIVALGVVLAGGRRRRTSEPAVGPPSASTADRDQLTPV